MPSKETVKYFGKDLEAMSFAINYHKWILAEFDRYLGSVVAEVGAGAGSFSKLLLDTDIESLVAFEPSQNMYPMLKASIGEDNRVNTVNDFFCKDDCDHSFDSILYVNVIEHIENDLEELIGAYDAIKQNGHLLIFVPALPFLYSNLDKEVGHYRRYTKRGLANLVKQSGFNIVKAKYFDVIGIIPWYINFVLLRNSIQGQQVALYDRLVIPIMRLVERLVTPPIGKNLLLVARKS